jgi:hypothetical protein
MKCIFNIGKNISMLAKVTQVSNVAHGPLVVACDGVQVLLIGINLYCTKPAVAPGLGFCGY